jgi:hypothetical protein
VLAAAVACNTQKTVRPDDAAASGTQHASVNVPDTDVTDSNGDDIADTRVTKTGGEDAMADVLESCREAGSSRIVMNRTSVVFTGKLRKRVMKPAAGFDSGQWHDVFVIDLEDPPCIAGEGGVGVYRTAQVDAVYQGTGPKAWYALIGHRVSVAGVADAWSAGRPHFFEPIVFDWGPTLTAAK